MIFWLAETIFFLYFFSLVETIFQENPSFQLVETDSRANNCFHKKKEKL